VWAQQASGIAGVVRDTTGAVLPGVTVEASSPALIEKVRTAVTDGEGRYNITELRPGTYTVVFSLPGFNSFRREGVVLTTGFTATINADMPVGALEETVTVTGASPLVDTQNVTQQKVVTDELLTSLPSSSMTLSNVGAIIPGVSGTINVGGAAGLYSMTSANTMLFHGKGGAKTQVDGMRINNMELGSSTGYIPSPGTLGEWVVDTGGVSAESAASGVGINYIPKDGSNSFRGNFFAIYTNDHLQSNNLTDELRARNLQTANKTLYVFDSEASLGGPLRRDRLWFYTSHRLAANKFQLAGIFYNKTQGTPLYTPDFDRLGYNDEHLHSHSARLTWQATQKNKFNFFTDIQDNCICHGRGGNIAPEAGFEWGMWPQGIAQVTWTAAMSSRLLMEAGAGVTVSHWPQFAVAEARPTDISIVEQSTGFRYNANNALGDPRDSDRYVQRFSVSYVTGSHAFKTGIYLEEGIWNYASSQNGDVNYRFFNRVPNQITQYATPYTEKGRILPDLGLFVQDQWTVKRFTLNYGLRFDYFRAYVPEQSVPAGRFVPAREFDRVDNVPEWTDLNPRLGLSYDLFGNGRTAVKASLGRYVSAEGMYNFTRRVNPLNTSVNNVNRTWTDNGNYVPDCDLRSPAANGECGPIDNLNFGQTRIATRFADDVMRGFGNRPKLWDFATEVQHEVVRGVSVNVGYYRNSYGNFNITDNLEVTPADFDPFCITAPMDPRLPRGGGYQVCGLYDVTPSRFGRVNNLIVQSPQKQVNNFVNVGFNTRFQSGIQLGGGMDVGRSVNDTCATIDSPGVVVGTTTTAGNNFMGLHSATTIDGQPICRTVIPFSAQAQVKLYGSYPLPGDFRVSGTYQNTAGPAIFADYPATNAQIAPSLGRNLSAGERATATVPLIAPQTMFESRRKQLDLRVTKIFAVGGSRRLEASVDVYNVFNASDVIQSNTSYGPTWLQPINNAYAGGAILTGRLVEFGGRLTF
jgi:hypothetical protein